MKEERKETTSNKHGGEEEQRCIGKDKRRRKNFSPSDEYLKK